LKRIEIESEKKMVTEQTTRYTQKNMNLDQLSVRIVDYLNQKGFATQKANSPKGTVIEARKDSLPRDLIAAGRALTILVKGEPDDFNITVGIGRWVQNLTTTVIESALTAGLFLIVDVPEMAWNHHIRNEVIKGINDIVEGKQVAEVTH
jgi:hypothetical protein